MRACVRASVRPCVRRCQSLYNDDVSFTDVTDVTIYFKIVYHCHINAQNKDCIISIIVRCANEQNG